jgi:hypothetical protein
MKVENVVYAPTKPVPIANFVMSETLRDVQYVRNQPRKRLPETLMTKVPIGKALPRFPNSVATKNLAMAPKNPAAPTARHRSSKTFIHSPSQQKTPGQDLPACQGRL